MKKKRFFGIFYKHQSIDGYTISVIVSNSNEGDMIQIITNDKSYIVNDIKSVNVSFNGISFDIHQDDLTLTGQISYGPLLKPTKDIMSYYRFLPIECKHQVYSLYHHLDGYIDINGKHISFNNGNGYIEGDKGRNFPKQYVWINAINQEASIVLAVATIPLGLITIKGITCLIAHNGKQYRFGTYNFAKVIKLDRSQIVIKKGKYLLTIDMSDNTGHPLKAPVKGDMVRFIHECPSGNIHYTLTYKGKTLMDITHPYASIEYVFDE